MQEKPKNKRTAVKLAYIPWGILSLAYTFKRDKKRFARSLSSVIFWTAVVVAATILPDTATVRNWAAENRLETELTEIIILISAIVALIFVCLENWIGAWRRANNRPQKWYEDFHASGK